MDPQSQFCHNPDCTARGQLGLGNISVHSRKDRRYRCSTCGRTFAATRDTPFYRLKKSADLVTTVITLLCHGCPVQAIVAAFGLDERTVADWRDRAGRHAHRFHDHRVLQGQVELGHVQADELYVKAVARRLWMAMAMAGVLSATGTGTGINTSYIERLNATFRGAMCPLVRRGRAIARGEAVLTGWMDLVGCAYNFCWEHDSLRIAAPTGSRLKWRGRTPAMAAGLTDHRWTMHELLSQPIPLPHWVAPKRR